MANTGEDVVPKLDPSNVVKGLDSILGKLDSIKNIAIGVAGAIATWKVGEAFYEKMKTTESQLIALTTTFQNAGKAVQEYQKALKYAAKTPFNVEQVIDAVKSLSINKLDPWANVDLKNGRNLINVLGDMGTAMGMDLAHATHSLNRALVGEWELMQNNYKISAKSIPQLKGLTSGTDEYKKAIIKFMVEQKRFIGGMDLQAKSLSGMISNLGDVVDIFMVGATGVADSASFLGKSTLYDSVRDSISRLYNTASAAPINDLQAFNGALQSLTDTKPADLNKLVGFDKTQNISKNLEYFYKSMGLSGGDESLAQKALHNIAGEAIITNEQLAKVFSTSGQAILDMGISMNQAKIQEKLGVTTKQFQDMGLAAIFANQALWEDHRAMDALIASGVKWDKVMGQGDKVMALGQIFGQVARQVWETFIDPIFEGLSWIGAATFDLGEKFLNLLAPLDVLAKQTSMTTLYVEDLLTQFNASIDEKNQIITHAVGKNLVETSVSTRSALQRQLMIFAIIVEFIKIKVVKYIKDLVDPLIVSGKRFFKAVGGMISTFSDGVKKGIDTPKILSSLDQLARGAVNIESRLMNVVSGVFETATSSMASYGENVSSGFTKNFPKVLAGVYSISDAITTVIEVFVSVFKEYLPGIINDIGEITKEITNAFGLTGDAVVKVTPILKALFTYIAAALGAFIGGSIRGLVFIVKWIWKIGMAIADFIIHPWDNLKAGVDWVISKFYEFGAWITNSSVAKLLMGNTGSIFKKDLKIFTVWKNAFDDLWKSIMNNRWVRVLFGEERLTSNPFKGLLDGLTLRVSSEASGDFSWTEAFSKAVNTFSQLTTSFKQKIDAFLNWKLPEWEFVKSGGILGWEFRAKKLATGTDFVPYDGLAATLHKGEMVVPAKDADYLRVIKTISRTPEKGNSPTFKKPPASINLNFYGKQDSSVVTKVESAVSYVMRDLGYE